MGVPMTSDYCLYDDPIYIKLGDERTKHIRSIRYQLWLGRKAYYERMKENALIIEKTIELLDSKYGIKMSKQTFERLYDPFDTAKIDITTVLRLCEIWEIDYEKVLAFPGSARLQKPESITTDWKVLNDKRYEGRYYCYFFKITGNDPFTQDYQYTLRKKEDLITASLDIKIIDIDKATATFTYENPTSTNKASRKFATCTPLLSKLGNIYFDFTDNDGRVYKISFNYRDFPSSGECYFRIASMLTEGSDQVHYPLFQKMVLFRNEPDASYTDHIRGLLNHSDKDILIRPEMLEELSDDPLIKKFMNNFCVSHYAQPQKPFYHFNEDVLLYSPSSMSHYEVKKVFMKMRHYSFSPNQIFTGNDNDVHRIAIDIQKYNNANILDMLEIENEPQQ